MGTSHLGPPTATPGVSPCCAPGIAGAAVAICRSTTMAAPLVVANWAPYTAPTGMRVWFSATTEYVDCAGTLNLSGEADPVCRLMSMVTAAGDVPGLKTLNATAPPAWTPL